MRQIRFGARPTHDSPGAPGPARGPAPCPRPAPTAWDAPAPCPAEAADRTSPDPTSPGPTSAHRTTADRTSPGPTSAHRTTPGPTSPDRTTPDPDRTTADRRAPRVAWRGAALVAAGAFALEMAVSARYGYHRDELYFLAAGQHPAFGYVDQPPLTPLAARAAAELTGNSLVGLRLLPALLLAALVLLTARMSALAGAGRLGQASAAIAAATCGEYLAAMHLLSTTTLDFVAWAITLLLALRLLATRDPRWWLAIGAVAGIGMEAKWTIAVLAAAFAAAVAISPARVLLRSRYAAIGLLIAAALAAPDLVWQAVHGWPNFAVFASLHSQAGHNRLVYWPAQVVYTGAVLTPVWISGLAWCLRARAAVAFRPVAVASVLALLAFFVAGGKPYYAGGVYTFLFAAGSVPLERRLLAAPGRLRGAAAACAASLVASSLIALPVLPARALASVPLQKINYDLGETIAWPRLVALVSREYHSLPPGQRAATAILTGNYGEAGAVDRYGPGDGLPTAYSGANNFWYWGPPPARDTSAIAVNLDPALLRRIFAQVRPVATFHNGLGVADDEQGAPVYLATGLREPWAKAWPTLRDFS